MAWWNTGLFLIHKRLDVGCASPGQHPPWGDPGIQAHFFLGFYPFIKHGNHQRRQSPVSALMGWSGSGFGHFCSYSVGRTQPHARRLGNVVFLAAEEEDNTMRSGDHPALSLLRTGVEYRRAQRLLKPSRGETMLTSRQGMGMGMQRSWQIL